MSDAAVMDKPKVELPKPTIRLATIEDFPACVDGIVAMREKTVWRHVPFAPDRTHILRWLIDTLSTDGRHRLVVAEGPAGLVGLCGGEITTNRFVPSVRVLVEWAWWVAQDYGHAGLGWKMFTELMNWARENGALYASYGKSMQVPNLLTPRPYEKLVMLPLTRQTVQEGA